MATPILVPPLGQTTDTVVLAAWYKREGESVRPGEPLYAIETDKATLDIEAEVAGILQAVTASAGDEVSVLSVIGVIADAGEIIHSIEAPRKTDEPKVTEKLPVAPVLAHVSTQTPRQNGVDRFFISPRARKLAEAKRVNWREIKGTGAQGSVIERDVLAWIEVQSQHGMNASEMPRIVPADLPKSGRDIGIVTSKVDLTMLLQLLDQFTSRGRVIAVEDCVTLICARALEANSVAVEPGEHVFVAVMRMQQTAMTVQLVRVPLNASIRQIRRLRDTVEPVPPETIASDARISLGLVYLDEVSIDYISSIVPQRHHLFLQIGHAHKQVDGRAFAQLNLHFPQDSVEQNHAVTLLNDIARMLEDPDLLY